MRSVTTWMGFVAAFVLTGCASEPAKAPATAAESVAAPAAASASIKPAVGEPTATQTALADKPTVDDDELICRNEKLLGTRIGKRVCKTRAQLKLEERSAREMMKNRDSKGYNANILAGGGEGG